jgi:hypothetical protein
MMTRLHTIFGQLKRQGLLFSVADDFHFPNSLWNCAADKNPSFGLRGTYQ